MLYEDFEKFVKEYIGFLQMGVRLVVIYLDLIGELRYYSDILFLYFNVFIDLRWLFKLVKSFFRYDLEKILQYKESFNRFGVMRGYFNLFKEKFLKEVVLLQGFLR